MSPRARVPSDDELRRITTRAVAEIVPHQEFLDGLRSGKPMRLKLGLDPTKPVITLGWTVPLRKLRQLQDLGHTVVIIVGDWTARIGDPSGQSQTRPMLTAEEVNANCDVILPQFYKILDESRTEVRRQSEWFDRFDLTEVVRLTARFTVAQILEREDFAQRYAEHRPIGVHELLYPLLQAYDSIAVEADVEFGGTDQKFNNLVGRELQRAMGQKAGPAGEGQAVFLVPLLVGLDGKQKMSQSLGNYVAISDSPHDMYGKLMSIPDTLIADYFELLTDVPDADVAAVRESVEKRRGNPMDQKMRLAREVVAQFHGEKAGQKAEDGFVRTFRKREVPKESLETTFTLSAKARERYRAANGDSIFLPRLLKDAGVVSSVSEGQRLIQQGAVEVDGEKAISPLSPLHVGSVIRVGKHRFLRIVDSDKS